MFSNDEDQTKKKTQKTLKKYIKIEKMKHRTH
jgi:hypothetical protein